MSKFRELEQMLKKCQKKMKKVLTKMISSDNIYLADAVKHRHKAERRQEKNLDN